MKNLWKSIKITLSFCALLGVCYVLVLWGVAQVVTPRAGQPELVKSATGQIVGVVNVGQTFSDSTYFWSRPSAVDYNGEGSGGSNKGVNNPEYLAQVEERVVAFMAAHPYLSRADVPSEMVTASASGLDPAISPASAYAQVGRIAITRGVTAESLNTLVASCVQEPFLYLFGTPTVNVLQLNVALDKVSPIKK